MRLGPLELIIAVVAMVFIFLLLRWLGAKGFLLVLVLSASIVGALYLIPVSVSYSAQEPYEALEPYEVQEPYQVQVQKDLTYVVVKSYGQEGFGLSRGAVADAYVTLRNDDSVPGTFVVDFTFTTINRTFKDSARVYILPGEAKTVKGQADIALGEDWKWSHKVAPGTKTATETRYRSEIKYKPVTRYKTVTKQKIVRLYEWLLER